MKIGIFGGSFDPFHKGHLAVIRAFLSLYIPEKLYIVPVYQQPLKEKQPSAPFQKRAEMIRAAFQDPRMIISDYENKKKGLSYTVETLKHFCDEGKLYLIMGSDSALTLDKWKETEAIFSLSTPVIYPRRGSSLRKVKARWGNQVEIMPMRPVAAASSQIRERIRAGKNCRRFLPGEVWEIIQREGLYGWPKKSN